MQTEHETAPSHEKIAYRAYEIYLEHGFHEGNALSDWLAAEKGLTEAPEGRDPSGSPAIDVPSMRKAAAH
jgi:hypothetical protein